MTGLPGRALFHERLRGALEAAAHAPERTVAVLAVDLDRFQLVNDTLGLEAGDTVLAGVARRLEAVASPGDTVGRTGGDEFAIVSITEGGARAAIALAERVLDQLARPFDVGGEELVVTASAGIQVALGGGEEDGADVLVRDAHVALHRAKAAGGARYEIFDPAMRRRLVERAALEQALRRALDRDEFELVYQPIVALIDGRVLGVESLLRWRHPERGLIAPAEFMPVAEDTGLVVPIGRWVIGEAVTQVAAWEAQLGPDVGYVSVNVSGRQLADPTLAADVAAALGRARIPAHQLALEVSETGLAAESAPTTATLQTLADLGVRLLLDDFGTGWSSLGFLRRLPLDGVKIDQSFVARLAEDGGDRRVAEALISMARALRLDVIGEGIETPDQARWLRRMGCGVGQGYAFGRPAPAEAIAVALRDGVRSPALGGAFGPVDDAQAGPARARSWVRGEESTMTLGEVADALGVSASTVRRWGDSGRLRVVRTTGGHRRFARADVERAAQGRAGAPRIRITPPPAGPLPRAATLVQEDGTELARTAGALVYEEGAAGWFAGDHALPALERWASDLVTAARRGDQELVTIATRRLADDAHQAGARLLEIDAFLRRYFALLLRGLQERDAPDEEIADTRRLFSRLRQRVIEQAELR